MGKDRRTLLLTATVVSLSAAIGGLFIVGFVVRFVARFAGRSVSVSSDGATVSGNVI